MIGSYSVLKGMLYYTTVFKMSSEDVISSIASQLVCIIRRELNLDLELITPGS